MPQPIICKDCPAMGISNYANKAQSLCFASRHNTTPVDPDKPCIYGITDYDAYLRQTGGQTDEK